MIQSTISSIVNWYEKDVRLISDYLIEMTPGASNLSDTIVGKWLDQYPSTTFHVCNDFLIIPQHWLTTLVLYNNQIMKI